MSGNDLVSIVMPAYNHARFIEEAVQSVIDQTYKNIEFLVIDDGSSDSTFELLQKMRPACEKRFVRMVMERQPNQGTALTLKHLFSQVKGRFLTSLASDDVLHSDFVQICYDFLSKNNDYGAVNVESDLIDEQSRTIYWNRYFKSVSSMEAVYHTFGDFLRHIHQHIDFKSDEFGRYESLLRSNHIQHGLLSRRGLFEQADCFTEKAPLEDWFMVLQIAKQTKIRFIETPPLYHYRWHGHNAIKQHDLMRNFAERTLRHEAQLVAASGDLNLQKRFQSAFPYDRFFFKSSWLDIFRRHTLEGAKITVKVLGMPALVIPESLITWVKKVLLS